MAVFGIDRAKIRSCYPVIAIVLAIAAPLAADTLLLDSISDDSMPHAQTMPTRGMTMAKVESNFGMPSSKHRPVGDPPITRWEYSDFVVYFEYRNVIHTVKKRQTQ